ncbi:hypothetical protein LNO89_04180 [Klebsiella pneumoniae subsp. pneumoniae]|nr:hypothetical protein [Klebsiella pneumoniae subsp. pneumoniae]
MALSLKDGATTSILTEICPVKGIKVTCGKHPGLYRICGGLDDDIHGKRIAGTLHSYSSCPCKSKFINSNWDDDYELGGEATVTHTDLPSPRQDA